MGKQRSRAVIYTHIVGIGRAPSFTLVVPPATEPSSALVASAEFTYCIDTGCAASPDPGVVFTVANFAGDVVGTTQYSVFTSSGALNVALVPNAGGPGPS